MQTRNKQFEPPTLTTTPQSLVNDQLQYLGICDFFKLYMYFSHNLKIIIILINLSGSHNLFKITDAFISQIELSLKSAKTSSEAYLVSSTFSDRLKTLPL